MVRKGIIAALVFPTALMAQDSTIYSDQTVHTDGEMTTTVISPPPSAISPQIFGSGNDLCTVGVAGAVQTQILGISAGKTVRDMNCERLKNAKTLYDMGMKVAAVSVMCEDRRVWQAMMDAGSPCPIDGFIGDEAKAAWEATPERVPEGQKGLFNGKNANGVGVGGVLGVLALLLLL